MTTKVYVNDDQTATFVCPECQKPTVKNVSKYMARNELVNLKVTCSCGHTYSAFLEKRKKFRKQTNLSGIYKYPGTNADKQLTETTGKLTVTDISFTGLRVRLPLPPRFAVGDKIHVEFTLNDQNQSLIRKEVLVRNTSGLYAGLEYAFNQSYDSALGFYLLSKT